MFEFDVWTDGEEEALPLPPLHAAAVERTSAAAPAMQAVRNDISRNLIGIHLLVINRTLVGDKYGVDRPQICLGYSHPSGMTARSNNRRLPDAEGGCIDPPLLPPRACAFPQRRLSGRLPVSGREPGPCGRP